MGEVNIVVTSKTAEISDNSLSGGDLVVVESPTLPLGQREGNFKFDILEIAGSKGCWTLDSVQVVIETGALCQEHWARNTLKIDICLELIFEGSLDEEQGLFLFQQILTSIKSFEL